VKDEVTKFDQIKTLLVYKFIC